jgi:hypothetical protein
MAFTSSGMKWTDADIAIHSVRVCSSRNEYGHDGVAALLSRPAQECSVTVASVWIDTLPECSAHCIRIPRNARSD